MIALNEIKESITRKLARSLPDLHVITEDASQTSDADRRRLFPMLHVQLQPMGSGPSAGGKTLDRVILVDITYMEEAVSSNEAMYGMFDRLQGALGFGLEVGDRFLKIERFSQSVADGLAHLTFELEFNDMLPWDEEEFEAFGELKLDNLTGGDRL